MIENKSGRLGIIVVTLALALSAVVVPMMRGESPFTLGLDLRGGVVLRYRLPEVAEQSSNQATESLETTKEIFQNRVDSVGVKEVSIRTVGNDSIEVAIPGISADEAVNYKKILQSVGRLEFRLEATEEPGVPVSQMTQEFQDELVRRRAAGEEITRDTDFSALTAGVRMEGQGVGFRWVPVSEKYEPQFRRENGIAAEVPGPLFSLLRYETREGNFFTGEHISEVRPDVDQSGLLAVGFTIQPGRPASNFGDFTERNIQKKMAIVLDGEIQSFPIIESKIPGRGVISGGSNGFTTEEQRRLIAVIKSGSLPQKPILDWENEIGPTLGEVAIERGKVAGGLAIGLILVFLLFYYMKAGMVACVALLANGILLMGALAALDATMTLPGIAGLVLTIGMAVDANILIFERIREEAEKGKTIAQSVKNGFDKAFFTIVDANVTTFLTAFFLFKFGTASIRGFAVVLMIGLVTSMFSALYFSKTIFAMMISKQTQALKMRRLMAQPRFGFLNYRRQATIVSLAVILVGLGLFFALGERKFGMDFTGGYEVQLAFRDTKTQADILSQVQEEFPKAEVVTVGTTDTGGARRFQIKVKTLDEGTDTANASDGLSDPAARFGDSLRSMFEGQLVEDAIASLNLAEPDASGRTGVDVQLRYAGDVQKSDVEAAANQFLQSVAVEGSGSAFTVRGTFSRPQTEETARAFITSNLRQLPAASGDGNVRLNDPMPSRSYIGPRAGTALRDAAIRAMFFSLVGIVLYIRIRFRQYRFGFAACVALIHDVLVTLGCIALVQTLGVVDVEIDLAVIAAFLTIIGYSLNDTIVIFDRVRENMPRLDDPLPDVLNRSINQTLSRTVLTTLTTLIAVTLLFVFNLGQRNVLEGFGFSLIVGVVVGTYSTIFVASPMVLAIARWAEKRKEQTRTA